MNKKHILIAIVAIVGALLVAGYFAKSGNSPEKSKLSTEYKQSILKN